MKLALNLSLFLFTLVILGDKSFSISDYKIKRICRSEKNESTCIKNLRKKRSDLDKGNLIEIPVKPYKNNNNLNFKF